MATDLENLATARTNLLTELASVTASPKKSYSIDGQSVDHNGYRRSLLAELREIDALMSAIGGPFEAETYGET